MTVRPILTVGDPVLRERAAEVSPEELPGLQELIDDLIETRRAAGGAGLAAPQVGVGKRIAVVEVDTETRYSYKPLVPLIVLVNPVVEHVSTETLLINEGCLSVPDLRGDVERALSVQVRFHDREGVPRQISETGLAAGTLQHEIDHLDGVLFLDRAAPRSFSTWEQFDRHHREAFLRRVAPWTRR